MHFDALVLLAQIDMGDAVVLGSVLIGDLRTRDINTGKSQLPFVLHDVSASDRLRIACIRSGQKRYLPGWTSGTGGRRCLAVAVSQAKYCDKYEAKTDIDSR